MTFSGEMLIASALWIIASALFSVASAIRSQKIVTHYHYDERKDDIAEEVRNYNANR